MDQVNGVTAPRSRPGGLHRQARRALAPSRHAPGLVPALATVVYVAALMGATSAGKAALVAVVALGLASIAWGWPKLIDAPSGQGLSIALAFGYAAVLVATAPISDRPHLRYLSVALAAAVVSVFVHQLARRDHRRELVASVTATAPALIAGAAGAMFCPLVHFASGPAVSRVALLAAGFSLLADAAPRWRLGAWRFAAALGAGAMAGIGYALATDTLTTKSAAAAGVFAAGIAHAQRRMLLASPGAKRPAADVAVAVSAVLLAGVVAWVVTVSMT